jgi:hypothetical protein
MSTSVKSGNGGGYFTLPLRTVHLRREWTPEDSHIVVVMWWCTIMLKVTAFFIKQNAVVLQRCYVGSICDGCLKAKSPSHPSETNHTTPLFPVY